MNQLYGICILILFLLMSNTLDVFAQYHGGDGHGSTVVTISGSIAGGTTDMRDETREIPSSFELYQNYPNPFNPETIITFVLPVEIRVTMDVYNIIGQKVSLLLDEQVSAGRHEVAFYAGDLGSGVYLYRLRAGDIVKTRKMMLVR